MNKRELSRKIQEFAMAVRDMTALAMILHREGALPDEGLADTIVYSKWIKHAAEFIVQDMVVPPKILENLKKDGDKLQTTIDRIDEIREKP